MTELAEFMTSSSSPAGRARSSAPPLEVFTERGYDAGSMRDIAARVGVSEPALYRHFPGKEALFLALMRLAGGRLRDEAFALIDAVQPETLREQLVAALRRPPSRDRLLRPGAADDAFGRLAQPALPRRVPRGDDRAGARAPHEQGRRARRRLRGGRRRRDARRTGARADGAVRRLLRRARSCSPTSPTRRSPRRCCASWGGAGPP